MLIHFKCVATHMHPHSCLIELYLGKCAVWNKSTVTYANVVSRKFHILTAVIKLSM